MEENNTYKGGLIATDVTDTHVTLWFSSPTGDSSDAHLFTIPCVTHSQAVALANKHNEMWGIDVIHEIQKPATTTISYSHEFI